LNNATFVAGVAAMEASMRTSTVAQEAIVIRHDNQTVSSQRGKPVAQELCNICLSPMRLTSPEVWTQLANCSRGVAISTVSSCVSTWFLAANTGWVPDSIRIVTTQLNDQVFKRLAMD
jgi:hypothetical protein